MGLFDSYYEPQTYAPGGGLIDRLLAQIGTQNQYQPSQGSNPMDASAAVQNTPIAVGNYQMPRIGSGFDMPASDTAQYGQATLPQNAQPTQGQLSQQGGAAPPQASSAIPDAFLKPERPNPWLGNPDSFLNRVMGTDAQSIAARQQNAQLQAQYKALLAAGVPQQKALLAVISPEAAKTILPQAFGADKFKVVQTGQDGLGRQQYEVFNASTGEHTPIKPPSGSDAQGGLGDMNLTGKDYLSSIPVAQRGIVQGIAEGTKSPPSSFALGKPYWQNIIAAVKNYDPTFDETQWSGRVAGVKDFSAGKSSEMVRSANQTLHHVGQLLDSMDTLNNGDYPLKNRIGNAISEATGSGAPGAFRTNAHAVAEELSKVFKGSNLSDAEIKAWESNLNENMSPDQQRAQVGKLRDLLRGSLEALAEKRTNSIGPIAAEKQGPLIKEEGQRVLQRIQDWISKGTGAAQGNGSAQTKTGVSWSVVQ